MVAFRGPFAGNSAGRMKGVCVWADSHNAGSPGEFPELGARRSQGVAGQLLGS